MEPWLRMDLNLLKALYVLLEERSVSRAADRFFVTRSAMSKTLQRLRDTLNDPVLVRTANGLVPTPRAQQLAASLTTAISHIEKGLASSARFLPAEASGVLRIAAPETYAAGTIARLLFPMRNAAPQLRLESLHLEDAYQRQLADGSIDFAIYFDQEYPEGFVTHPLFSMGPMIWCRKDHPIAALKRITLDDICNYPKLAFHLPSIRLGELLNVLDTLEKIEIGREVMFETNHLLVALVALRQSDALMIAPDYLFKDQAFADTVVALPLDGTPLFDTLRINLSLVQHERTLSSPMHQWAAQEILRLLRPEVAGDTDTIPAPVRAATPLKCVPSPTSRELRTAHHGGGH